jgi:hypothetical protein
LFSIGSTVVIDSVIVNSIGSTVVIDSAIAIASIVIVIVII